MEDFTAGEVRARDFRIAMRGFDQAEVQAYLEELASYLDAVQQQLHSAGISELAAPHDLSAEYGAVGEEVARVLEEARAAADAMRSRATAEVAEWRARAIDDAEQARGDAWATGVQLLEEVSAACNAMLVEAQDISLRLRAEAERDSTRMVTEAQREREELARSGREEAERTVAAARKEADALLMSARHQADVAHERTRALEERRTELMTELESTQKAMLGIDEEEASSQREEEPAPGYDDTRSHWPEDDGAVRIVERPRSIASEPVDAEALAAEVRAMRRRTESDGPEPAAGVGEVVGVQSHAQPVAAAGDVGEDAEPGADAREVDEVVEAAEPPADAGEADAVVEDAEPGADAGEVDQVVEEAGEVDEVEAEPHPHQPDPLAGLFDSLRGPDDPAPESPNGETEPEGAVAVITEPRSSEAIPEIDPFALRDRLLLPVQNRALRQVKRQLVAAQNRALEELRLDSEWSPGPDLVNGQVAKALDDLLAESAAAGNAAVFELVDDAKSFGVTIGETTDDGTFARAFVTVITETLERSRTAGAGKREVSSSLSRVFRAWRTDDAERRLRRLSRRAYHDGLLAALTAMGCDDVRILMLDRSCVDHSEAAGSWPISSGPPAGVLVPPASLECSCTIVPDC